MVSGSLKAMLTAHGSRLIAIAFLSPEKGLRRGFRTAEIKACLLIFRFGSGEGGDGFF
jgi:hypothetical protein